MKHRAISVVANIVLASSGELTANRFPFKTPPDSQAPLRKLLLSLMPLVLAPAAAFAQKEISKAPGFDQCPAGYVNTFGTTCVSPVYYEVAPTNGEACKAGWMNIGAGYCKKKKGPLGVL